MADAPPVRRLLRGEPAWPDDLDRVEEPPVAVWVRGRTELLDAGPRVAVVGTRTPSPYGDAQARRFASELAVRGVTVVSGLARGVDARAHEGALDVGGGTVAVLGSGVDRPWPGGPTAERVLAGGLVLSELPPGTGPRRHHFPLRNRLIAGLAQAVLVVEAARASGSLITARWAADLGRQVFALPGRVDQPMARGCHRLLRDGAALVESPEELAHEMGWGLPPDAGPASGAPPSPLAAALVGECLPAEELARRADVPLADALVELVRLELEGAVVRAPGGLWRLAHRGG